MCRTACISLRTLFTVYVNTLCFSKVSKTVAYDGHNLFAASHKVSDLLVVGLWHSQLLDNSIRLLQHQTDKHEENVGLMLFSTANLAKLVIKFTSVERIPTTPSGRILLLRLI